MITPLAAKASGCGSVVGRVALVKPFVTLFGGSSEARFPSVAVRPFALTSGGAATASFRCESLRQGAASSRGSGRVSVDAQAILAPFPPPYDPAQLSVEVLTALESQVVFTAN